MSKYRNTTSADKLHLPKTQADEMARIFGALAHPHRLQIFLRLAMLCKNKCSTSEFEASACVGQAGKGLGIAPSTLSHHIKELKNAGLLKMEKAGQKSECSVDKDTVQLLAKFFQKVGKCEL